MSSGWETTSFRTDPLREGLVKRAKKRSVRPKTDPHWWAVSGSSSLGDAFDSYDVHLRDDGSLYCSCSTSMGGEYRKNVCSHRTAVILWRQDHEDPWDKESSVYEAEDEPGQGESSVRGSAVEALYPGSNLSEPSGGGGTSPLPQTTGIRDGSRITLPPESMSAGSLSSDNLDEPDDTETEGGAEVDQPKGATSPSVSETSEPLEFDPFDLDENDPPRPQAIAEFFGNLPQLPAKFEKFRPDQWAGIIEVVEALDDGVKCVFLSAPTGSGKSLVAATIPQILGSNFVYTATTHVLQDQVEREFTYAKVLKGRRNYPTFDDPDVTAEDCTKERMQLPACPGCPGWNAANTWGTTRYDDESDLGSHPHCYHCHPVSRCPYEIAKYEAANAHMAVLNTTYFLSETNYVYQSLFRHKDLVFIDEADMLEEELMSFITVEITAATRKDLGIGLPNRKGVQSAWVDWIRDEVLPAIDARLKDLPKTSGNLFGKPDPKINRLRKKYERLHGQVKMLLEPAPPAPGEERDEDDDTPALMSGWVMTGMETKRGEDKLDHNADVIFKPVMVRDYARQTLWNMAGQFVLLSATIISPEQMAYDLGLEDDEWVVVEIPSSFPKERRPVIPRTQIDVTKATMDSGEAFPILTRQLLDVMEEHPNERILVHSNSYKLTRELFFEGRKRSYSARERMVTYLNAQEREATLRRYLDNPNSVLVAPSFQRGVDLHGDDCRVVVIAKVPFPYLGDKQVSARLYGTGRSGKTWYSVQTIRTLVQMTGRGMRSRDDWAISYILDKSFLRIYWDNQHLFPSWWREAIVLDENDPKWREPLRLLKAGEL